MASLFPVLHASFHVKHVNVPPSAPDRSGRSSAILRYATASHLPGYAEPLMGFGNVNTCRYWLSPALSPQRQ
ncbi:hypothetical protein V8N79_004391 [Salmonella enterica]